MAAPIGGDGDVELVSRRTLFDGFLRVDGLRLRHRLFAGGASPVIERELLVRPGAAGVLLYDPGRERVVMVRQFRTGALDGERRPWLLELVAGIGEAGESPRRVALRETAEEAGLVPRGLIRICEYYSSPGISDERVTLFCGRVDAARAGGIHGVRGEHEDIEVVSLPLDDALAAVADGAVDNAMSIIALQWLALNRRDVRERWEAPARKP